jgi:hypothetical protein
MALSRITTTHEVRLGPMEDLVLFIPSPLLRDSTLHPGCDIPRRWLETIEVYQSIREFRLHELSLLVFSCTPMRIRRRVPRGNQTLNPHSRNPLDRLASILKALRQPLQRDHKCSCDSSGIKPDRLNLPEHSLYLVNERLQTRGSNICVTLP